MVFMEILICNSMFSLRDPAKDKEITNKKVVQETEKKASPCIFKPLKKAMLRLKSNCATKTINCNKKKGFSFTLNPFTIYNLLM